MTADPLRVLVVDDTVVYRKIVGEILGSIPGVEVAGVAANGKIALQKIEQLHPDLLTLDLEMPEIDGLGVLRHLKQTGCRTGAIMLSAFTTEGADATVAALKLGAFDFVIKPAGDDLAANTGQLRCDLHEKIEAFARSRQLDRATTAPAAPPVLPAAKPSATGNDVSRRMAGLARSFTGKPEVVALGISTGGPAALARVLPHLPADLAAPLLIVQHMPPKFTESLAKDLDARSPLAVREAVDGLAVRPGQAFIAPGGKQMKIERSAEGLVVRITDDPPENHCKPSVDYLFRSVSHVCGGSALGVIMTGMGSDGALGCRLLKRQGAGILVQDAATCVVYGMPKPPTDEGLADVIAPLDRIAAEIVHMAGKGAPAWK